jgi:hypothetical protein
MKLSSEEGIRTKMVEILGNGANVIELGLQQGHRQPRKQGEAYSRKDEGGDMEKERDENSNAMISIQLTAIKRTIKS